MIKASRTNKSVRDDSYVDNNCVFLELILRWNRKVHFAIVFFAIPFKQKLRTRETQKYLNVLVYSSFVNMHQRGNFILDIFLVMLDGFNI